MRPEPIEDETSTTFKRRHHAEVMRKKGRCALCPPHGGENRTHYTRGPKKPRASARPKTRGNRT